MQDAALRAVGRNLVNFQKLEHCLKFLSRLAPIAWRVSTVEQVTTQRVKTTERLTLGNAVQRWLNVAEGHDQVPQAARDMFEPTVSLSYQLLLAPEQLADHAAALERLAGERNTLVHHQLAQFDFDCEQACREFVVLLDDQNERILAELSVLAAAITSVREMHASMTSPELLDGIEQAIRSGQLQGDP